jgi:hypothetical protein
LDGASFDHAELAAEGEARTTGSTEGEEAGDQQGAVSQCFGGEHAVKLWGGRRVGKSKWGGLIESIEYGVSSMGVRGGVS